MAAKSEGGGGQSGLARGGPILDWAVSSDPNRRHRRSMEDAHAFVPSFLGDAKQCYFGVFDGHGGPRASKLVARRLHEHLEHALTSGDQSQSPSPKDGALPDESPAETAFFDAFRAMDNELAEKGFAMEGTTAVACVAGIDEKDRSVLVIASVGDSRAVLASFAPPTATDPSASQDSRNQQQQQQHGARSAKPVVARLTRDHKVSDPRERARVTAAGGFIGRQERVNGVITVSRALGDHALKNVVIGKPDVVQVEVGRAPCNALLIVACDGLWDVLSDTEAVDLCMGPNNSAPQRSAKELADLLVYKAIELGTTDNVSVLVAML